MAAARVCRPSASSLVPPHAGICGRLDKMAAGLADSLPPRAAVRHEASPQLGQQRLLSRRDAQKLTRFIKYQIDAILEKPVLVHYHRLAALDSELPDDNNPPPSPNPVLPDRGIKTLPKPAQTPAQSSTPKLTPITPSISPDPGTVDRLFNLLWPQIKYYSGEILVSQAQRRVMREPVSMTIALMLGIGGLVAVSVLQIPRPSLGSSPLIGNLPPADSYIDVPWLVSMPGNCQGIVLTPWLILSTANCLKKSKMSHLDISGVNDPESIPRGQRICLYPKFDPQDENDPVKADIGLVILEEPLYGEEIPISQSSNISLKSCSKCQYRSCEVYEYQSSRKLGTTTVKKIAVQLLDFSTCYHQHSYLEKTEGLCIQSQPREDCWIQRASPVLCLLKNHWELVGLIHKTSRICQNPTVIIRTAPYFSWMKRFIKWILLNRLLIKSWQI
ncbi:uncharacterized protein LOC100768301 isoform X2 [Cricetulus griseus]|uniref:Uncharacterized protein LOC100768301 isoform X2 n=1 Tax=Cricetulus griseus TaxID=10029 RepID=A0A9J7KBS7_CRIGR|nr:uncharacterized protein LOC100768301 isoform X2 [Cricetulus griseus]